jgi:hypothetical protein
MSFSMKPDDVSIESQEIIYIDPVEETEAAVVKTSNHKPPHKKVNFKEIDLY